MWEHIQSETSLCGEYEYLKNRNVLVIYLNKIITKQIVLVICFTLKHTW